MANSATAIGFLPNGERIEFTLNGLAMADQIDKLIKLSAAQLKEWNIDSKDAQAAFDDLAKATTEATESTTTFSKGVKKQTKTVDDALTDLQTTLRPLVRGNVGQVLENFGGILPKITLGIGSVIGGLVGYADSIKDSLQRGISGNIFDIAIAAKSAGLTISEFNKAIAETGGSFSALGTGATDGAKQFGALVGNVREATKSVGNFGMSNDQLAQLTAQQVKVAVAQGFKGKQAQEVVVRNSRVLGQELDNLANRTGKSTLELAQAAAKMAQDPLVANFVRSAKQGSQQVSAALQTFTASIKGLFGEQGDQIAKDALQSALSGLPMVVTQTGKNMILAGSSIYTEIERQAQAASRGEKVTDADRARLREMIVSETKTRSAELNQFALLGGAVGDSAKQLLAMANEAENYNSAENVKRRAQDKTALEFNASIRDFQANMQALAIPFLQLINNINWGAFISVISTVLGVFNKIAEVVGSVIDGLFNWIPGLETVHGILGTLVGGFLGLSAVIVGGIALQKLYKATTEQVVSQFQLLLPTINKLRATIELTHAMANGQSPGRGKIGRIAATGAVIADSAIPKGNSMGAKLGRMGMLSIGSGLAGAGISAAGQAMGPESAAGKSLGVFGGAVAGAGTGASFGMLLGPKGALAGAIIGGVVGGIKEAFGGSSEQSAKDELQNEQLSAAQKAEKDMKDTLLLNQQVLSSLRGIHEEAQYNTQINSRGVSYQASTDRKISNLQDR